MNHKAIVKQVRVTLERDARIKLHRFPITIATQNGDLILSGDVESITAKKLALLAAAEIHGRIVDRLKVTPAEKMEDAEIRDHVCKVLVEEPAFEHCVIRGFCPESRSKRLEKNRSNPRRRFIWKSETAWSLSTGKYPACRTNVSRGS